jgi:hypothetical protein
VRRFAQISESFDVTVWVNNHQMNVVFVHVYMDSKQAFRKEMFGTKRRP